MGPSTSPSAAPSSNPTSTYPALACGTSVAGSTHDGYNRYGSRSAEKIYLMTLRGRAKVTLDSSKSGFSTTLRVFTDDMSKQLVAQCTPQDFSAPGCSYRPSGIRTGMISLILPPGRYTLLVEGLDGIQTGVFSVAMACETIEFAGDLTCGVAVEGSTAGAKTTLKQIRPDSNLPAPQHIWGFTLTHPTSVKIDACGARSAMLDTYMRLMSGDLKTTLAANDDGVGAPCDVGSRILVGVCDGEPLPAGSYVVVIEGWEGVGPYNLKLDCTATCTCNKAATTPDTPSGIKRYTSFEEPLRYRGATIKPYTDTNNTIYTHHLRNNPDENAVAYVAGRYSGAVELGFSVFCDGCNVKTPGAKMGVVGSKETCSGGGDLDVGSSSSYPKVAAPHGVQYFLFSDTDGPMTLKTDGVASLLLVRRQVSAWVYTADTGWEDADQVQARVGNTSKTLVILNGALEDAAYFMPGDEGHKLRKGIWVQQLKNVSALSGDIFFSLTYTSDSANEMLGLDLIAFT